MLAALLVEDQVRDFGWESPLETFWQDVRYAIRMWRRSLGFTAVAVLTLSLGMGAVTAICSVADATLLRPLPYLDADRLVALRSSSPTRGLPDGERTARGNLADWQAQARSFDAIAGYRWRTVDLTGGERSERLRGLVVTPEFFDVFGIRPQIGRGFVTGDRGTATIILGHDVWQQRFGADIHVVGKPLNVNVINLRRVGPTPFVVLGIVTADVHFPPLTSDFQLAVSSLNETIDFWIPESIASTNDRENRELDVVGKLRAGVTIAEAQAEVDAIARRLAKAYPASNRDWGIRVTPLRQQVLGTTRRVVLWLSLSSGLVLLIACGNVASLLLARGLARQREMAIRAALGAGRLRIMSQLLVESALIALPAAVLGVIITSWGITLLRPLLPSAVPLLHGIDINLRVLGFTLISALLTTGITGIAPALRISRVTALGVTGLEGRGLSPDRTRHRTVGALVASEVALTLILLIGTGLMVKSAAELSRVDPGFNPRNLLTMTISLPNNKFEWRHNVVFSRQVIDSLKSLEPVRGAAVIQGLPMRTGSFWGRFEVEAGGPQSHADGVIARIRVVSPGYFGVMQVPILSGRDFDERDDVGEIGRPPYVIVNQALAKRYWPGEDAVGKGIRGGGQAGAQLMRVAGVVGDVRYAGIDSDPGLDVYYPEGLFPQAAITLLVRTSGDPLNVAADVRSHIRQIDKEAFVSDIRSMGALISDSMAPRRSSTMLLTVFAGIALLLALIGIYGVITQAVAQRQLEIGIRVALGAGPQRVVAHVLKDALVPALVGMAVGLAGAVATTRLFSSMLFGIRAFDPGTWATVILVTLTVCVLASYIPALRARNIDPNLALRAE